MTARSHSAQRTRKHLEDFKWEILDLPTYSPDLAPSGYHLFGCLKKHLCGQRFHTLEEAQQALLTWLGNFEQDFFEKGMDDLVPRWNKCFDHYGSFVE
ncbi:Histone-lysine N-methyltransferase SETMAR [Araneus ventricosus]|uniref:Histone-lysine N-methyltransferase SETMAR n=1 Tax=Araneus ventricosus TaxID=182803 RepID=A0A4Y2CU69_ARAVE|nr:Histone-lysine N-methyltransferase SETMAR [Araneus ventricosus]